jgi:hypothetical protein
MILPHDSKTSRAKRSKISRMNVKGEWPYAPIFQQVRCLDKNMEFTLNLEAVRSSKTLVTADTIYKATI